ncbi:hypothetical protein IWZ01DRAFT_264352 [Phyllosticta capitalensis]
MGYSCTSNSLLPKTAPALETLPSMPLPMYTSEKPSTSETNTTTENSGAQQSQAQASTNQTTSTSYQDKPKSEAELAAEKLYEERMEEEYAKREGGA